MTTLNPLVTVALPKAVAEATVKEARPKVKPGRHHVDVTVRILGDLDVGEPFVQRCVSAVPWEQLAKMAFDRLNPASQRLIVETVRQAQRDGALADLREEIDGSSKEVTWAIFEAFKDDTTRTCNGKVTARLTAEIVK